MGYYANGGGCLTIKKENFDKVVEAYHVWTAEFGSDSSRIQDIKAVFEDQWFEPDFDQAGNLVSAWFPDEKWRDESEFLEMLAPFVEDGSILDFSGEDGAHWRISYKDHQFYETDGTVIYPGDPYWEEAEGSK